MRRGYRCAFFLFVLFACIQASGCKSGGTTALTVTTTSLPNAVIGTPYSATLTASGGTPGYTWSQVSGGPMPGGISLASTGAFNGIPTVTGTFGPYVFQVTDSTGASVSSGNLSITTTTGGLSIVTGSLPQGVVNSAYSFTLAASGGAPPYTWTQASGPTMPPGLAGITSGGLIAGTPTATGTYGPYVFTVTDSANAKVTSSFLTITITLPSASSCLPLGNESALTSATPYAFLLQGTDGSGNPIDIAGSFTPDGSGGIVNATADYNGFTSGPVHLQVNPGSSTYSFGSSSLGCLALVFSGPVAGAINATSAGSAAHLPHSSVLRASTTKAFAAATSTLSFVQFSFALSGFDGTFYHTGRIIESDNAGGGTNASGFLHAQLPSAFSFSSMQSNYAFGLAGWAAASAGLFRTAIAGTFANSSGALSAGFADLNSGGTPSGELTGGSGTLNSSIDATTGRGTGTYTIPAAGGNLTFDFVFYILNGSDLILLSTDSPVPAGSAPLLSGRVLASNATYAVDALNGYYLLASQGLEASGTNTRNLAEIGTLNATSASAIPTATLYVNDAGTFSTTPYSNASYTVEAASGRVSITGLSTTPPIVYLTAPGTTDDGIAGFLVGSDTQASSGVIVAQSTTAPAYLLSSISGNYAASTQEDVDGLNGSALGAFSFTGTGQYSSTQSTTGSVSPPPNSGTIAVNSDGSGSLNNGSFPFVTNGNVIFAIPSSGDPLLYVFTVGTAPN
ncbi:MAG TPA: hypothetical protein VNU20_00385 [Candidatus Sulfotelmatobacter sp.]|jgi:hypothetical protein|nr:hypothetical protein [Candidatus Sulfotelmatobacter sp.]